MVLDGGTPSTFLLLFVLLFFVILCLCMYVLMISFLFWIHVWLLFLGKRLSLWLSASSVSIVVPML